MSEQLSVAEIFQMSRGAFEDECRKRGLEPLPFAQWLVLHYLASQRGARPYFNDPYGESVPEPDPSAAGAAPDLIAARQPSGKWWLVQPRRQRPEPIGPFDTKEEAEAAAHASAPEAAAARSMTYGDLVQKAPRLAATIQPHEWDNMNISEQRDWVVMQTPAAEQRIHNDGLLILRFSNEITTLDKRIAAQDELVEELVLTVEMALAFFYSPTSFHVPEVEKRYESVLRRARAGLRKVAAPIASAEQELGRYSTVSRATAVICAVMPNGCRAGYVEGCSMPTGWTEDGKEISGRYVYDLTARAERKEGEAKHGD